MFSNELNGYNREQVDKKIKELEMENLKLSRSCAEKDGINLKLATAVNKAKEIESSSYNLFKLKIQKLTILYQNLEQNFQSLLRKFPQLRNIDDLKEIFDKFSKDVKNVLKDEFHTNLTSPVRTENDTIRLLLNKMSSYAKPNLNNNTFTQQIKTDSIKRVQPQQNIVSQKQTTLPHSNELNTKSTLNSKTNQAKYPLHIESQLEIENVKEYNSQSQIKPISTLTKDNENEEICDKFLKIDEGLNDNAYAKMFSKRPSSELYPTPNESGFDLKEAVNPKEDLSEIMKSFHFND